MEKKSPESEYMKKRGYFEKQTSFFSPTCPNCGDISQDKICRFCSCKKEYTLTEFFKFSDD